MWRALKSLNIRTFNIDAREIELVLIKIIKMKDKEAGLRKGLSQTKDEEMMNLFSEVDQDHDLFLKKIRSEL